MVKMRICLCFLAVLLTASVCAVSCIVRSPVESGRTVSALSGYVSGRIVPTLLCEPAVAVSVASDVDRYLALTDAGKETFETEKVFPGGIRHIDDNSLNVKGVASVYSDGQRLGTPGARWTVRRAFYDMDGYGSSCYTYYNSGYDYYSTVWEIECEGEGVWKVVLMDDADPDSEFSSEITVRLSSEDDSSRDYEVTASGTRTEDVYSASGRTVDGPVTVRCVLGSLGMEVNGMLWSVRPVSGQFNTDFYRGTEHLDYCNYTYTSGEGITCETGLKD